MFEIAKSSTREMREDSLRRERGSSILEALIALSVLTLGVSAAALLSFANQTLRTDSNTSGEALYKARDVLENVRASSTVDFSSIVSTTTTLDDIYTKKLTVSYLTPCRKEVTSTITWVAEPNRPQIIALATDLTDIAGLIALGGDCASEPPSGGWTGPRTLLSRDLKKDVSLGDNPSVDSDAGNPASDIDVLRKTIYMTALPTNKKDTFFILDGSRVLDSVVPPIVGSLNTGPGLNGVDVAQDPNTGKYFAYAANASSTNSLSSDELLIIDVSNSSTPTMVSSVTLGITPNCPTFCPGGAQAVYYYNGRVYVGTHRIQGREFYVFSVSAPYSPTSPQLLGSYEVDHNVNAIVVRGSYAYLATSANTKEVIVLDVSSPTSSITEVGSFDAKNANGSVNGNDGTRLFLLGNKLYLGRDPVNKNKPEERDFYIIDVSSPNAPMELGSANLQILVNSNFNAGTAFSGIVVSGRYAFLANTDSGAGFIVLDISNPAAISTVTPFYNYSNYNTGIDFEDGVIYTSNKQNYALRIIVPAQCADKIDNDGDGGIDTADPQCHTDGAVNNPASYDPEKNSES